MQTAGARARRIAFRVLVGYGALYAWPFPFDRVPYVSDLAYAAKRVCFGWGAWFGRHVLGVTGPIQLAETGSSDRTIDWIMVPFALAIALIGAAAWSAIDRARGDDARVAAGARVVLRYWLGLLLIEYGLAKVFQMQFPSPSMAQLVKPYGQASPMGLLWTFMGYSKAYCVFTGGVEVLAGALLFLRRTTTLGALLGAGVLANILMLNLSYDVPVKLFSAHLLVACCLLVAPDLRRLVNVLVLNRRADPVDGPAPESSRRRQARLACKLAYLGLVLYVVVDGDLSYVRQRDTSHPVDGFYRVEGVAGWRWFGLGNARLRIVRDNGETERYYSVEYAPDHITVQLRDGSEASYRLTTTPTATGYIVEGSLPDRTIRADLHRVPAEDFLLLRRGFHFVSESPFNR